MNWDAFYDLWNDFLKYMDRVVQWMKFLFTGDAEKHEEDGIWTNIKCDVLKVGHHGSDSSSTSNFLKKRTRYKATGIFFVIFWMKAQKKIQ